jgi:hypothetical protein
MTKQTKNDATILVPFIILVAKSTRLETNAGMLRRRKTETKGGKWAIAVFKQVRIKKFLGK